MGRQEGEVLARRFHKFFSLDENEEASLPRDTVINEENVVVTEKLDGSLVSPFLLDGEMRWATRAAECDSAAHFAASAPNTLTLCRVFLQVGGGS